MIILTNPPFTLCTNKRFLLEMKSKKDAVILATFKFCNKLGNVEVFDPEEWIDLINATALAIYSSYEEKNTLEKPVFYEKYLDEYDEAYKDDYIATCNSRYYNAARKGWFKNPKFKELTPDIFITKTGNKYKKKGDPVRRKIYPKNVREVYERYKDQIDLDTYLWRNHIDCSIKIRKEFFNDDTN